MSLLDLDKARAAYSKWVNGTDDPPTLDEEEARLLSHRITAHHFPNLLAAHLSLRSAVAQLADDFDGDAEHYERIVADHNRSLWVRDEAGARAMAKRDSARRLRSLLPQERPDKGRR